MLVNEIIFLEAKAMLKYALGNGLKVPNDVVENIKNYQEEKKSFFLFLEPIHLKRAHKNNMKLEQQNMQNKLQLLNQLESLQKKISSGSDSKALLDELNQIQKQLLDG